MFFRADLRLFVCGFEVNAGAYEGAWSVFWLGKLRRSGRWHLVFTWHTALSDKARLFPFCKNDI